MAPPMLALPDNILFPSSAGIEMVIQAYFDQVLSRLSTPLPSRSPSLVRSLNIRKLNQK